ncbi:MAG: tetratricopeptide repeat protein, partial [Polyangiaceae bacterium]|nr:tetratricopeptide repeat protein [Polyangiaceae bacterium]
MAPASTPSADEVRFAARQTESGFQFERQHARGIFLEALGHAEAGECGAAVRLFERVVEQFPGSRYMPPALYDAAVCWSRLGDDTRAAQRLEMLVRQVPESRGAVRAKLELASVYARLERW